MIETTTALMKPIYEITQYMKTGSPSIGCSKDVQDFLESIPQNLNALTNEMCLFYDATANSYKITRLRFSWYRWLGLATPFEPDENLAILLSTSENLACAIINNKVPT